VLLVEDDDLIRSTTSDLLREEGHLVIEAGDAEAALEALGACPIDVLLADVGLPKVSGVTLAREARARFPALKIIFATGDHAVAGDAADLDASLLGKPYTPEDLREAIDAVGAMERAEAPEFAPGK
jgi:DNA-binding response OmpR family regulator